MRLDLLLKVSGIIKRRTVAKTIVENEKVLLNGRIAKPSSEVKEGDILTLKFGMRTIQVEVHYEARGNREYPKCIQLSNEKEEYEKA